MSSEDLPGAKVRAFSTFKDLLLTFPANPRVRGSSQVDYFWVTFDLS